VQLLESGFDLFVENDDFPGLTQSVFNISGLYQRAVASPESHPTQTVIVKIEPSNDPKVFSLFDICEQRKMMTNLLHNLAKAQPAVVVLDKYYSVHQPECFSDVAFKGAIQGLMLNRINVVVGRRISDEEVGNPGWLKKLWGNVVGNSEVRYYLLPSLPFDKDPCLESASPPCFFEGIVNIDPDTRKLPLQWLVFPSKDDANTGQGQTWHNTLALAAARASKLPLAHPKRLSGISGIAYNPAAPAHTLLNMEDYPFISFLKDNPKDPFKPVLASQLLAGDAVVSGDTRFRGKIVLIGEINKDLDQHKSVLGDAVPGVYLQANYIEALLDDRYYRHFPILDYIVGFCILVGLEFILIAFPEWCLDIARKLGLRKAGRILALLITIIAVCLLLVISWAVLRFFFVKFLGWYVNPVLVGAAVLLIKLLHLAFGWAERKINLSFAKTRSPEGH